MDRWLLFLLPPFGDSSRAVILLGPDLVKAAGGGVDRVAFEWDGARSACSVFEELLAVRTAPPYAFFHSSRSPAVLTRLCPLAGSVHRTTRETLAALFDDIDDRSSRCNTLRTSTPSALQQIQLLHETNLCSPTSSAKLHLSNQREAHLGLLTRHSLQTLQ